MICPCCSIQDSLIIEADFKQRKDGDTLKRKLAVFLAAALLLSVALPAFPIAAAQPLATVSGSQQPLQENDAASILGSATKSVQAEQRSGLSRLTGNAALNDCGADFTAFGGTFGAGDYLRYDGVDFGTGGQDTCMLMLSVPASEEGKTVQVRLDSPDAQPIGTVTLTQTPNDNPDYHPEWVFCELYADIVSQPGIHDVYFTFDAETTLNLDWFLFTSHEPGHRDTEEEHAARTEWWRKLGFGQFIHWGAYAQLGGWYEGQSTGYSEWIQGNLNIPREDYEANATAKFNPTQFDAQKIVSQAKAAGQDYIVFTSRHHEGYSMYDTKVRGQSEYSLPGAYGREVAGYTGGDPMKELADECHRQGLKFATYYTIMEWHDGALTPDGKNIAEGRSKEEFITRLKAQIKELIEVYDTDILWFDGQWYSPGHDYGGWWTQEDGTELFDYVRSLKPSILINNRAGGRWWDDADYQTPEQEIPDKMLSYDWETCMTLNGSWGYHKTDGKWKDANTVVDFVTGIRSKGGNFLLNIGPDQDGAVPAESQAILADVARWMERNKETIKDVSPTCFDKLPGGVYATTKEGKIYLHLTEFPTGDALTIPAIANKITGVTVRNAPEQKVSYTATKKNLIFDLSGVTEQEYSTILEISVEGVPSLPVETNLATTASKVEATTNYNDSTYSARAAVDGDQATRWASADSAANDQVLTLTFDEPVTVNSFGLTAYFSKERNNYLKGYRIEYLDGAEWKTAFDRPSGEPIPDDGVGETGRFDRDVTSSRFRLVLYDANKPSIYEFGLFDRVPASSLDITAPYGDKAGFPLTVAGTSSGGSSVQITVSGQNFTPVTLTTPIDEQGNWAKTISKEDGIELGTVTVTARLLDETGAVLEVLSKGVTLREPHNLAYGAKCEATPTKYFGYEGDKALDENPDTRWGPDGATAEMTIDFGAPTALNQIVIHEWLNNYRCTRFTLEYFDGEWKPLHEGTTIGERLELNFETVTASKLRFKNLENNTGSAASLAEFQVFYNSPDQPPVGEQADKSILQTVIDAAAALENGPEYNAAIALVQKSFSAALDNAQAINQDAAATQQQVDNAWIALMKEIHKLGLIAGDKTTLLGLLNVADSYQPQVYTPSTWALFAPEREKARDTFEDPNAMQEDVDRAVEALADAMLSLRCRADKSLLTQMLGRAGTVDLSRYTPQSVRVFQRAYRQAQGIAQNSELTDSDQPTVDGAVTALEQAMNDLALISQGSVQGDAQAASSTRTPARTGETLPGCAAALFLTGGAALLLRRKTK